MNPRARLAISIALATALCAGARAQTTTESERVDTLLSSVAAADAPGFAVGVYQHDRSVFSKGYGSADLDHNLPITHDTVFNLASVSKQFTAFAIALLAQEGKVDLQADIRTYLPWMPHFSKPVTVANLIHHTSGMPDYLSLAMLAGRDDESVLRQQQILNLLQAQKTLSFAPGSEYEYSNSDYVLLAEIVRAVTGESLRNFLERRVFKPLGMTHTRVRDALRDLQPSYAVGYEAGEGGAKWHRAIYNREAVGPGNVLSTVDDMLLWAHNFAQPAVGTPKLIDQLTEPVRLDDGTRIGYGFALKRSRIAGHDVIVHDGGISGFRALFTYFPDSDFAVVILSNGPRDDTGLLQKIVEIYLAADPAAAVAEAAAAVAPMQPALRHEIAGHYQSREGRLLTLEDKGEELAARDVSTSKGTFTANTDGTFRLSSRRRSVFRIERAPNGSVSALVETMVGGSSGTPNVTSPYRTVRHERVALSLPSATSLGHLTGTYRNNEIDAAYTVSVGSGRLMLRSLWMPEPQVLVPTSRGRFDSLPGPLSGLTVTVHSPTQLVFHYENVRNLTFSKVSR